MMSLTFGLFTQVSGSGPLGPLVFVVRSCFVGWTGAEAGAGVGRLQTSSSPPPPLIFIAGRPKAALLFWFFGDFRCGALLFMVIHVVYKYNKNR